MTAAEVPWVPTSCLCMKLIAARTLRVTQATKNTAAWREHRLPLLPVSRPDNHCECHSGHPEKELVLIFSITFVFSQKKKSQQTFEADSTKHCDFFVKTSWYESSKKVVRCDLCQRGVMPSWRCIKNQVLILDTG